MFDTQTYASYFHSALLENIPFFARVGLTCIMNLTMRKERTKQSSGRSSHVSVSSPKHAKTQGGDGLFDI